MKTPSSWRRARFPGAPVSASMPDLLPRLAAAYQGLEDGFASGPSERARIEAVSGPGAATYGEVLPEGAATLLRWLPVDARDVFYDLGSGTGKLVIHAALATPVSLAAGIELCPLRHRIARRARERILRSRPDGDAGALARRIDLRSGDFLAEDIRDATIVFFAATCYGSAVLSRVALRAASLPRLRLYLTTRDPGPAARLHLEERGSLFLPMSWSPRVRVFVFSPRAGLRSIKE